MDRQAIHIQPCGGFTMFFLEFLDDVLKMFPAHAHLKIKPLSHLLLTDIYLALQHFSILVQLDKHKQLSIVIQSALPLLTGNLKMGIRIEAIFHLLYFLKFCFYIYANGWIYAHVLWLRASAFVYFEFYFVEKFENYYAIICVFGSDARLVLVVYY